VDQDEGAGRFTLTIVPAAHDEGAHALELLTEHRPPPADAGPGHSHAENNHNHGTISPEGRRPRITQPRTSCIAGGQDHRWQAGCL